MTDPKQKFDHLDWAIRSRANNQLCCLRLLRTFETYEELWKTQNRSRAAQELIAIAFSLWRAAFLAEKDGSRKLVLKHGRDFLCKLVEDNAISYPQDKSAREWTFNFYTRNARYSLLFLSEHCPDQVPVYKDGNRNARQRWDYCQELLSTAVENFGRLLEEEHKAKNFRTKRKVEGRVGPGERRRRAREPLIDSGK